MAKAQDLINVLAAKARFEAVDVAEQPNQIRILGRVRQDGTSTTMDNWLLMMNSIAEREEQPGCKWKVDISRKYFRRAGKLIFAWRLIIQGEELSVLLQEVIAAAQGAPLSSRNEVTEVPLGARGDRNALVRGKGAGASGTVPVGPWALQGLRGGGG
jgi:hypothetical protein